MAHRQLETFLDECQGNLRLSPEELVSLQKLLTEAIGILKNVIDTPPPSPPPLITCFDPLIVPCDRDTIVEPMEVDK